MKSSIHTFIITISTKNGGYFFRPKKESPYYINEEFNKGIDMDIWTKFSNAAKKSTGCIDIDESPYWNSYSFTFFWKGREGGVTVTNARKFALSFIKKHMEEVEK